ncbi:putative centromere kinetochore protein zw10 protein [Neofusicoccum parvum UCRNP2]|uniref:Putative centromere kinetochore protein zw10 protein n=1 Tax=Botryosphaeria parva (strain UCR-NP2) TaxID=1287680 RepID=R1EP35_BOTPV|nr:putative centromere kinetochore protein zw10 protein [Neofusicoccum parvum UCRNP2]
MIVDIEDMSDISEEESKRLRDFCTRVSALSDLFVQPQQQGDMTGVYTPNWFKFQYLGEILESSLADIKYLWTEGELKLEYGADEVVDLIEALFADSDYRRRAIADIKRTAVR